MKIREYLKEWGINTDRILSPIKLPTADVIMEALNLYQGEFRKPSPLHILS